MCGEQQPHRRQLACTFFFSPAVSTFFFGSRLLLPSCEGLCSNLEYNCDPDGEVRETIRREMLMFDLETLCLISDSEGEMIFFFSGGGLRHIEQTAK